MIELKEASEKIEPTKDEILTTIKEIEKTIDDVSTKFQEEHGWLDVECATDEEGNCIGCLQEEVEELKEKVKLM